MGRGGARQGGCRDPSAGAASQTHGRAPGAQRRSLEGDPHRSPGRLRGREVSRITFQGTFSTTSTSSLYCKWPVLSLPGHVWGARGTDTIDRCRHLETWSSQGCGLPFCLLPVTEVTHQLPLISRSRCLLSPGRQPCCWAGTTEAGKPESPGPPSPLPSSCLRAQLCPLPRGQSPWVQELSALLYAKLASPACAWPTCADGRGTGQQARDRRAGTEVGDPAPA